MASFAKVYDSATPKLRRLAMRIGSRGLQDKFLLNWAVAVRQAAMAYCLSKGGRRFWLEIASSIQVERGSGVMTVEAQHVAAAQKQYGGVIKAKGKAAGGSDHLTIPISPEAEGKTANRFALSGYELFALGLEDDNIGALGYSDDTGAFVALFALVTKTRHQQADPFMPSESEAVEFGLEEAVRILAVA